MHNLINLSLKGHSRTKRNTFFKFDTKSSIFFKFCIRLQHGKFLYTFFFLFFWLVPYFLKYGTLALFGFCYFSQCSVNKSIGHTISIEPEFGVLQYGWKICLLSPAQKKWGPKIWMKWAQNPLNNLDQDKIAIPLKRASQKT